MLNFFNGGAVSLHSVDPSLPTVPVTSLSLNPPLPETVTSVRCLPPSSGLRADGLTPGQRRWAVGAIVAAHAGALWALLQVAPVREAAREAIPMFFERIAPPAPPVPPAPVPPPPALPQPARKRPPQPVIAATPSPAPAPFVVPAPAEQPPEPSVVLAAPAPAVVAAPPVPASAPAPRVIPPSAVQYLVEPAPEYPRAAIRNREVGRVVVRFFISEAGLPSQVQVERSSGFPRLDESAVAAVSKSRIRPPTVDGRPVSGWTLSPIDFSLER